MMPYIDVPERCEECERLVALWIAAAGDAEMIIGTEEYALDQINKRNKARFDLNAHRRVCRVWQAAHV